MRLLGGPSDLSAAADGVYIRDLDGALGRLRRYDYATGQLCDLPLPLAGAVQGPVTDPLRPGERMLIC